MPHALYQCQAMVCQMQVQRSRWHRAEASCCLAGLWDHEELPSHGTRKTLPISSTHPLGAAVSPGPFCMQGHTSIPFLTAGPLTQAFPPCGLVLHKWLLCL